MITKFSGNIVNILSCACLYFFPYPNLDSFDVEFHSLKHLKMIIVFTQYSGAVLRGVANPSVTTHYDPDFRPMSFVLLYSRRFFGGTSHNIFCTVSLVTVNILLPLLLVCLLLSLFALFMS